MKRALVCGAGGFIGSHLVKKLKKEIAEAAKKWDFEKAAQLRDRLLTLEKAELTL